MSPQWRSWEERRPEKREVYIRLLYEENGGWVIVKNKLQLIRLKNKLSSCKETQLKAQWAAKERVSRRLSTLSLSPVCCSILIPLAEAARCAASRAPLSPPSRGEESGPRGARADRTDPRLMGSSHASSTRSNASQGMTWNEIQIDCFCKKKCVELLTFDVWSNSSPTSRSIPQAAMKGVLVRTRRPRSLQKTTSHLTLCMFEKGNVISHFVAYILAASPPPSSSDASAAVADAAPLPLQALDRSAFDPHSTEE